MQASSSQIALKSTWMLTQIWAYIFCQKKYVDTVFAFFFFNNTYARHAIESVRFGSSDLCDQ